MQKINNKQDLQSLCRACMHELRKQEMKNNLHNMDIKIRQWLEDETLTNPLADDNYPEHVCNSCCSKLKKFLEFYQMCKRSLKMFEEMLAREAMLTDMSPNVMAEKPAESSVKHEWLEFDFVALPKSSPREELKIELDKRKEDEFPATPKKEDSLDLYDIPTNDEDKNIQTSDDSDYSDHFNKGEEEMSSNSENETSSPAKKPSKSKTRKKTPRKTKEKPEEPTHHVCEECGKVYRSLMKLVEHQYTHKPLEEYPFHCDEPNCGKAFRTSCGFQDHKLRHAGIKKFHCHLCDMKKTSKKELDIHINYHTKEKKYECPKCSMVFYSANDLRTHDKVVHLKIRRFTCSFCNHQFAKKYALRNHEMRHTGERPYTCKECGKGFIQLVSLRTHMKSHGVGKMEENAVAENV
ncbi:zinc finger protein 41 [Musca domestica]|uniref:Zinc finger protein 41 n=1 Tax=Musca domestica TaxID=7370 RepID=A0A9J7CQ21_MUSDO|nr:zinc finger protein 41 [Musca domestica]